MKLQIVAVSDRAVGAFMRPFFAPSTGAAVRSFSDEVNRAESEMAKHPTDYELHHFGSFDEEIGRFELLEAGPMLLVRAKDMVRHAQSQS